jgi:plastocyanin
MDCSLYTYYLIMCILLFAITGLIIIFCSPVVLQKAVALETRNNISIVPGASSINNIESFKPNVTSVTAGTNITWTNDDSTIHTVNSGIFNINNKDLGPEPFESGLINPGGTFIHLFKKPNIYDYYCSIHPFMTGKIIVR